MRITQAYVSKSVMDFPFHSIYSLDDYKSSIEPSVFFGMYRYEDFIMFGHHRSDKIAFWTGQDALDSNCFTQYNVTAHPKVYELIKSKRFDCTLVQPSSFLNTVKPQQLGKKIYAYCPLSAQDYHGKKVIDELRMAGYEIIIGDGQFSQNQWRAYYADIIYHDVFIGLCLSEFAGGGTSIIEMGLRGIKVITNVFNLPNCLPWTDAQDVAKLIEIEKVNIGYTNRRLASNVWNKLDHEFKWLEI